MTGRTAKRGFVLVMVLVVLAVAGSLLAAVAHRTTLRSAQAGEARSALQRKWAFRSLQAVCFARAEEMLKEDTTDLAPPPVTARRRLSLGGTEFTVIVADEQAKANVNLVAARRDKDGLRACVSALSGGGWTLQVIPRPVEEKSAAIRSVPMRYASLEQVFFGVKGPMDLLGAEMRGGPAEKLTAWGNGKVNFRRAEASVLREALEGVLDEYEVHHLVTLREAMPSAGLSDILKQLDLKKETLAEAEKSLVDASACHSVWIVAGGKTRQWHRLYVRQEGDAENDAGSWILDW